MACSILILAVDRISMKKGYPISVNQQPGWTPGALEGLPNWIIVDISDADAVDVRFFMQAWDLRYEVTTVQDIPARARLRFVVDPAVVSASGMGRDEIKVEMDAWAIANYGATPVNNSASHTLIDFPKPLTGPLGPTTIDEIAAAFGDVFDELFDVSRYYVAESDVDIVVNPPNNGRIALTQAQALATINDKFLD